MAGSSDEDATLEESVMTMSDVLRTARYIIERFGQDATQPGNQPLEKERESDPSDNGVTR
jgi:hypothetical protein